MMFTKRESRVILFLGTVLLIGTVVNLYGRFRKSGELNPAELIRHAGERTLSEENTSLKMKVPEPKKNQFPVQAAGKIKINSATPSELISIPGIGPVLADRIINYRGKHGEFKNDKELLKIKGIGPRSIEEILKYIEFD